MSNILNNEVNLEKFKVTDTNKYLREDHGLKNTKEAYLEVIKDVCGDILDDLEFDPFDNSGVVLFDEDHLIGLSLSEGQNQNGNTCKTYNSFGIDFTLQSVDLVGALSLASGDEYQVIKTDFQIKLNIIDQYDNFLTIDYKHLGFCEEYKQNVIMMLVLFIVWKLGCKGEVYIESGKYIQELNKESMLNKLNNILSEYDIENKTFNDKQELQS